MTQSDLLGGLRDRRAAWELAERSVHRFGMATATLRTLPDYVLIGTKRGGTTSVAYALLEHPQVVPMFPSATILPLREHRKGVHHYFAGPDRGDRWYRSHFPTRPYLTARSRVSGSRLITGDASPYYLYRPGIAERFAELTPDARILVMLRDPVERAHSHFKEQRRRGLEPLEDFEAAVEAEAERVSGEADRLRADPAAVSFAHENQSYVGQGEYAAALVPWLDAFGDRVLVRFSDHFYADGPAVFDDICRFLDIEPLGARSLQRRNPTAEADIDPELRRRLRDHYRPSDEQLAQLIGVTPPWRR